MDPYDDRNPANPQPLWGRNRQTETANERVALVHLVFNPPRSVAIQIGGGGPTVDYRVEYGSGGRRILAAAVGQNATYVIGGDVISVWCTGQAIGTDVGACAWLTDAPPNTP
jgi:hypothetical protein